MITIRNLTRHYGSTVAVSDVSTDIQRGEIVGLLGHNGAGKTTVMKILTGFLDATSGTVKVDGLEIGDHRTEVQQRIGYLPENAPLYEEMSVQAYLETIAALRGVEGDEVISRVAEALEATDLLDRVDAPISTLSKGLRQRVGIAQAIVHRPDVLVLDEPTNGLDPTQIQSIRALVRKLGTQSTILLSTHILQEIEAVCDRVLVMIKGQLVADAPLASLLDSQRVALTFTTPQPDAPKGLGGVDGVTEVIADDSTGCSWVVRWHGEAPPVQALIDACHAKGWGLAAIAPEQRTLEGVFADLQRQHALGGDA